MTLQQDPSLSRALDDVTSGILILDREWRVEFVNRAAEGFFGVPREELVGKVVEDVFSVLRGTEAARTLVDAARTQGPSEVELEVPGRPHRLLTRIYPSHGGVVLTFHTSSERHPGEAHSSPGERELARQARDQVLGIVSHDLRGPLNAIALNAAVLARRPGDARALDAIRGAVAHAHRLLQDLALATRVETGTIALERQLEPLKALVDEIAGHQAALARTRDVTLELVVRDGDAAAAVDRARVVQAVGTLLARALSATPRGGRVLLEARGGGGGLEIVIQDSGPGLPADEARRLFDGSWEHARAAKSGAGLGLRIARGLVEAHGGSLSVDSAPGRGTRFTLRIPPPRGAPAELARAAAP